MKLSQKKFKPLNNKLLNIKLMIELFETGYDTGNYRQITDFGEFP